MITQTLIEQRLDIATPWFSDIMLGRNDGSSPKCLVGKELTRICCHALSEDELTKDSVMTYGNIESLSHYLNAAGLKYNRDFFKYYEDQGVSAAELFNNVKFSGGEGAVQVTFSYAFPNGSEWQPILANRFTTDSTDPSVSFRTDATQIDNVIKLTYQYASLEEFSLNKLLEYKYFDDLIEAGATREFQITYIELG
jgi:hypothetical protein